MSRSPMRMVDGRSPTPFPGALLRRFENGPDRASGEARGGERLVDAGLDGRALVPGPCSAGPHAADRMLSSVVDIRGPADRGVAVDSADADDLPFARSRAGLVTEVAALSRDILEVVVDLRRPLACRPGQYVNLRFAGFPARDYSPTARLDGALDEHRLVFHIRRYVRGRVSSEIGRGIRAGHPVQVRGPFGQCFLRPDPGLLVLASSEAGWAAIWSIARAARLAQPSRPLIVIAGARDGAELYMRRALDWLAESGNCEVIPTAERNAGPRVRPGKPSHYLPALGPDDTVHVAGSPRLAGAVMRKACAVGARCYADPFVSMLARPSRARLLASMLRVRQAPAGLAEAT